MRNASWTIACGPEEDKKRETCILQGDVKYGSQISDRKPVVASFMLRVSYPRFATIKEGDHNTSLVYSKLGVFGKHAVLPHPLC